MAWLAGMVSALVIGSGCGRPMKEDRGREKGAHSRVPAPGAFDVRIWGPRGANLNLPGELTRPAGGESPLLHDPNADRTFSEAEVVFNGHVLLPGEEQPRFLAWSADVAGRPIISASYQHDTLSADGRIVESGTRLPVSSDPGRGVWFIPIHNLVEGDPVNANPTVEHRVRVELFIGESDVRTYLIRFRAIGIVPGRAFRSSLLAPPSFTDPAGWVRSLAASRSVLAQDEVVNPTERPLVLWARGRGALSLETGVAVMRYAQGRREEVKSWEERSRSTVPLSVRAAIPVLIDLETGGARGDERPVAPDASGWWSFPIPPKTRLQLRWLAGPDLGAGQCELPREAEKVFAWDCGRYLCRPNRGEGADCEWRSKRCENRRTDTWSIRGARLTGSWEREVLLVDAAIAQPSLELGPGLVRRLEASGDPAQYQKIELISGDVVGPDARPHSCQGVFP